MPARPLFHRQIRHEPRCARPRRRTARQDCRQRAVAARHHRHAAIKNLLGGDRVMRMSRKPEIMADAAYAIFQKPAKSFTGHFLIDDSFLAAKASAISRNTAPCRASRWPAPSSSRRASRSAARRQHQRKKMGSSRLIKHVISGPWAENAVRSLSSGPLRADPLRPLLPHETGGCWSLHSASPRIAARRVLEGWPQEHLSPVA